MPWISHLCLSSVSVYPYIPYKLHCLSLGYFCSNSPPMPHCTMPILCWAVCSAYFIHETIRGACISPQLHPHSRDSSLHFGIVFLFQPHPSLSYKPASVPHHDQPPSELSIPQEKILKFSPLSCTSFPSCLIFQWPDSPCVLLFFSSGTALLNF